MSAATSHETHAARLRKPSWRDPRLVIGVLLVVLSVAAVVALVAAFNRTQPYYVAGHELSVGQRITPEDLVAVDVRLQDASAQYLPAEDSLADGAVAVQRVPQGQLVPAAAVGTADALDRSPVGLQLDSPPPSQASAGSHVDVWVAERKATGRGFEKPRKLLTAAEIASVTTNDSALGASTATTVTVLVSPQQIAPVVDAVGNDARITLVLNTTGGAS